MWRLLAFIFICALFLVFVGLNLEHTSDISLGFWTFYEIPVFLTAFSSFLIGMFFAVPFVLSFRRRQKKTPAPYPEEAPPAAPKKTPPSKRKKDVFTAEKVVVDRITTEKDQAAITDKAKPDEVKKESSPYGID